MAGGRAMRSRRRLFLKRAAALGFLIVGAIKTRLAIAGHDPLFYADACLYLGLAALWNESARRENHQ